MEKPLFNIITTAKNENNYKEKFDLLDNWNYAINIFERRYGLENTVRIIIVDGGNNVDFLKILDKVDPVYEYTIISHETYSRRRLDLFRAGIIKKKDWDSPSIGRNIGYMLGEPDADKIIFQDFDSRFSTGSEKDLKYITSKDIYSNYFEVMYESFSRKNIVAAAPSLRACDSKENERRLAIQAQNASTRITSKIKAISVNSHVLAGPSIPGPSAIFRRSVLDDELERMRKKYKIEDYISDGDDLVGFGPYHPEIAIAEDYELSRRVGSHGSVSYEKEAGVFVRTLKRVKEGHTLMRSFGYLLMWIPHYLYPEFFKYKRHTLRM